MGGPLDNGEAGAAWVFTRRGEQWTQEGTKLVGSGTVGAAWQGASVALCDDYSAIVGGPHDDGGVGAAWLYNRVQTVSGGDWRQQGTKLVGSGAVGAAHQGHSVALSAEGNTAIVGGPHDDSRVGAAWVYIRSAGVWSQQAKLVGSGAVGAANQGMSVALSDDGNTAIVGGPYDYRIVERRGSSPAAVVSGHSREQSWSAAALCPRSKTCPSCCLATATPPSWEALPIMATRGQHGPSPAGAVSGRSREQS